MCESIDVATSDPSASSDRRVAVCPYCDRLVDETWFEGVEDRLGYAKGRWAFHRCQACGSAVLSPYPEAGQLSSFYPPVYGFTPEVTDQSRLKRILARLEYRLFFQPQYRMQVNRVLKRVGQQREPRRRLLDVGCGRGLRLLSFRSRGFDVEGMDFQPEVTRYLQDELNIQAVCTDFEGLPQHYACGSFDVITAFCVLEHVHDVRSVLRICSDLLRPSGWLVALVPLADSFQARLFGPRWLEVREAPRHLTLPSCEGMKAACARAGLVDVRIEPNSALTSAGLVALSVLPNATTTHVYGSQSLLAVMRRAIAAAITLGALPWCLVENHVLCRPAGGLVFARKPATEMNAERRTDPSAREAWRTSSS